MNMRTSSSSWFSIRRKVKVL